MTDHDIVTAMQVFGGNFIKHLAQAWLAADPVNQERIKTVFAVEWQEYAELAQLHAARMAKK